MPSGDHLDAGFELNCKRTKAIGMIGMDVWCQHGGPGDTSGNEACFEPRTEALALEKKAIRSRLTGRLSSLSSSA